jgi:pilus assembly protein CpaB
MNRNRMLVLAIVALVLSAGVTYVTYRLLQTRLQPVEETSQIVTAAQKLALGARLTEKDIKLSPWPKSTPLEGSFADLSQVLGRAVLIDMLPNEPILESKLAPKEGGAGLTVAIPEGMRAISIQVNSVIAVTGFVGAGSRVDLILTGNPPSAVKGAKASPDDQLASKIILENLQVLAVGQNIQKDAEGKPQAFAEVTILVTPEQAEKIALATGDGRIQLVLRNPLDNKTVDPPLVFRSALYAGSTTAEEKPKVKAPITGATSTAAAAKPVRKPKPASVVAVATPTPPPPPAPKLWSVELIQGSKRATENFEEKKLEDKKPQ